MASHGEIFRGPRCKAPLCLLPSNCLTREHIWGQWTWDVVPFDDDTVQRRLQSFTVSGRSSGPMNRVIHPTKIAAGNLRRRRAKVVCARCNNGWMSLIEKRIKARTTPVLTGGDLTWSVDDLHLIALWVQKTALVHEADQRRGTPHEYMRYQLRTSLAASPDCRIWIAKTDSAYWSAGTITRSFAFAVTLRAAISVTTMSLGPLVFVVMIPFGPHGIPSMISNLPNHAGMRQIWPSFDPVDTLDLAILKALVTFSWAA